MSSVTNPEAVLSRLWRHLPRVTRRTEFVDTYNGTERTEPKCQAADATVMTSEVLGTDRHAPVLDLDMPCTLVPSSTPDHYHLIIETAMSWRRYRGLLRALARAGIIERGYYRASIRRGYSAVRVPWVKK